MKRKGAKANVVSKYIGVFSGFFFVSCPVIWIFVEVYNAKAWIRMVFGVLTMLLLVFIVNMLFKTILSADKAKMDWTVRDSIELLKAGKQEELLKALESDDPRRKIVTEMNKACGTN